MIVFHPFIGVPILLTKDLSLTRVLEQTYSLFMYTRSNSGIEKTAAHGEFPSIIQNIQRIVLAAIFLSLLFVCL